MESHWQAQRTSGNPLATGNKVWSQSLNDLGGVTQTEFEASVSWGRAGSPLVVGNQAQDTTAEVGPDSGNHQ